MNLTFLRKLGGFSIYLGSDVLKFAYSSLKFHLLLLQMSFLVLNEK